MTDEKMTSSERKRREFGHKMFKQSLSQGNWLISEDITSFEWYRSNVPCDVISIGIAANSNINDMIQPLKESGLFEQRMVKGNSLQELSILRVPQTLKGNTLLIELGEMENVASSSDLRLFISSMVNFAASSQLRGEIVRLFWIRK